MAVLVPTYAAQLHIADALTGEQNFVMGSSRSTLIKK